MRFKDIKTEAPEATSKEEPRSFTDKLQNPDKRPSFTKAVKDKWQQGQEWRKKGTGKGDSSAAGIIKNIAKSAKAVKDVVAPGKGEQPDPKQAKATAQPQTATQQAPADSKYSTDKILGPKDLRPGSMFQSEDGTLYTYQANSKSWVPNVKGVSPINAKKGIDIYNMSKTRKKVTESKSLLEAEARINHAEDLVFFNGSAGAKSALAQLKELANGGQEKVTVKWDGSPAVIFGRDENGEFMLTDKSGFGAKGYDGKNKSPEAVEKMFLARPGAKDPARADGFKALAASMKNAYIIMDKAVPKDFRGYFKGDLLYFNTPQQEQDMYVFKPNIVTYNVKTDSDIGKRIGASTVGVVIHRVVDEDFNESPITDYSMFTGNDLYVLPPVSVVEAPKIDNSRVENLEALINKNASAIDSLLDKSKLQQMKVSDFNKILYQYINSKVDTGLDNLGRDFLKWLDGSKVSVPKQQKITNYVKENLGTFSAMWDVVTGIMKVKDNIIGQLDSQDADVVASINGKPGGEGYVLSDPKAGDMKLVNRAGFSAANRAQR